MIGTKVILTSGPVSDNMPVPLVAWDSVDIANKTFLDASGNSYHAYDTGTSDATFTNIGVTTTGGSQQLSTSAIAFGSNKLTVNLRIKTGAGVTNLGYILSFTALSAQYIRIFISAGAIYFEMKGSTSFNMKSFAVLPNTRYNLVIEFNKATNTLTVWTADGQVILTNNATGAANTTNFNTTAFMIGQHPQNTTAYFFNGTVYIKTRVYNRLLTVTERNALLAIPLPE